MLLLGQPACTPTGHMPTGHTGLCHGAPPNLPPTHPSTYSVSLSMDLTVLRDRSQMTDPILHPPAMHPPSVRPPATILLTYSRLRPLTTRQRGRWKMSSRWWLTQKATRVVMGKARTCRKPVVCGLVVDTGGHHQGDDGGAPGPAG